MREKSKFGTCAPAASMRGVLSAMEKDRRKLVDKARSIPSMAGLIWPAAFPRRSVINGPNRWTPCSPSEMIRGCRPSRSFHVVAYDFGIKHNILRRLVHVGLPTLPWFPR